MCINNNNSNASAHVGIMPDSCMEAAMDINEHDAEAYMSIAQEMRATVQEGTEDLSNVHVADEAKSKGLPQLNVTTGTARDQFQAPFMLAAYAFLFPYGIGAPDLRHQPRHHRDESAPRVDFEDAWAPCLMMRAEAQFRRDLTLPFALWNLVFRTCVNIGSNLTAVTKMADAPNSKGDVYNAEVSSSTCIFEES